MKDFVFSELADFFSQPCLLLDEKGRILEANKAALSKLQTERKSIVGEKIFSFVNGNADRLKAYLKTCSASTDALPGRIELISPQGHVRRYQCHAARYKLTNERKPMMLFRFGEQSKAMRKFRELNDKLSERSRQIHSLRVQSQRLTRAVQRAEHRALVDPLTDLYNRRALDEDLKHEQARHFDDGSVDTVLAIIDLDGMKRVNDTCGHTKGDALLTLFSRKLLRRLRKFDKCYRIGGDEFAVLMAGSTLSQTGEMNRRFRSIVQDIRANGFPEVDFSVGYASLSQAHDVDDLFAAADARMYQRKRAKKNTAKLGSAERLLS